MRRKSNRKSQKIGLLYKMPESIPSISNPRKVLINSLFCVSLTVSDTNQLLSFRQLLEDLSPGPELLSVV